MDSMAQPRDASDGGEEGSRPSSRAKSRRRAQPQREPTLADTLGLSDYVERQPLNAVIAAAMTGYAIAWYLRGGRRN